jgi:outer membrane protein assembly factor BamB
VKWQFKGQRKYLNVAVGAGKVYCAVLMNKRAGETEGNTYAFDIATGKVIWENNNGHEIRHSESQDILLTGMGVLSGQDGSKMRNGSNTMLIAGPRLIEKNEKDDGYKLFDLSTGAKEKEHDYWNRRGCTSLRFSPNLATTRYLANAAYVDLDTQKITPLWNVRNACSNNLFPADGLLNMPNLTGGCECNYTPTAVALVPLEEIGSSAK